MPKKKPRIGRPPKPEGEKYLTPARQIGRWSNEDWQPVLDAIDKSGKTQSQWFRDVITAAVKKQSKQ